MSASNVTNRPDPTRRPCRRTDLEQMVLAEELVIYVPGPEERALSLNHTARAIWELCDGRLSLLEISRELGRRFQQPAAELLPDVQATVAELDRLGAITWSGE